MAHASQYHVKGVVMVAITGYKDIELSHLSLNMDSNLASQIYDIDASVKPHHRWAGDI